MRFLHSWILDFLVSPLLVFPFPPSRPDSRYTVFTLPSQTSIYFVFQHSAFKNPEPLNAYLSLHLSIREHGFADRVAP